MKRDGISLILMNLFGFGLAGITLVSYTAGIYFEGLLIAALLAIPFFIFQLIRQTTWKWRLIFIFLLVFQIYSFSQPTVMENFNQSKYGLLLSENQIESLFWITPYAAGICLTSFWISLINTLIKNKKNGAQH
jgi:hypothetical protein